MNPKALHCNAVVYILLPFLAELHFVVIDWCEMHEISDVYHIRSDLMRWPLNKTATCKWHDLSLNSFNEVRWSTSSHGGLSCTQVPLLEQMITCISKAWYEGQRLVLWDVISFPYPWYLLLEHRSSIDDRHSLIAHVYASLTHDQSVWRSHT